MYLFLMVFLAFITVYISYSWTITLMYKLKSINKIEDANSLLLMFKIVSYTMFFILLTLAITTGTFLKAGSLVYIFYIYMFATLIYIRINLKFLNHIVTVMFASDELEYISFERFFCSVEEFNGKVIASYRIEADSTLVEIH